MYTCETQVGISLIKTTNSIGHRTEPCGTPEVTGNQSDELIMEPGKEWAIDTSTPELLNKLIKND